MTDSVLGDPGKAFPNPQFERLNSTYTHWGTDRETRFLFIIIGPYKISQVQNAKHTLWSICEM